MKLSLLLTIVLSCFAFSELKADIAQEATIDRLTLGDLGSGTDYRVSTGFAITPWRDQFFRSDGVVFRWGAGVTASGRFDLASVSIEGDQLRYEFDAASAEYFTEYTDFSFGDYSSTGTLVPSGALVVTADIGSNTATLEGAALITANGYGYATPQGALYTAPVGSVVPLLVSYQLASGTWALDTFDSDFSYRTTGAFEFAAVPEPNSFLGLLFGLCALTTRRNRH